MTPCNGPERQLAFGNSEASVDLARETRASAPGSSASNLKGLLIPYALDSAGCRIVPCDAERGREYRCPECEGRLILRKGEIKTTHFAHHRAPESCRFLSEGWLHVAAKHAIFHAVSQWLEGRDDAPEILRSCETCHEKRWQSLPDTISRAEIEGRLSSGRVADVLLSGDVGPAAVIEIRDTHAVDEAKQTDLGKTAWGEINAAQALRSPTHWEPIACGNFRPFRCRCSTATKVRTIRRGYALHVDGCPIPARTWHGKAYANVIDDCSACQHLVAFVQDEDTTGETYLDSYVLCDRF